jgi:hyperosmotically inducible periplasmic protein
MKAALSLVVPLLGLLSIAPAHLSAEPTRASQTAAATTKDRLSKSGEVMTDGWITARIHERFVGEDLLKDSDISVQTSDHVVTLTGTVTRWVARTRAEKIVKGTEGVDRVVNQLTVGSKRTD